MNYPTLDSDLLIFPSAPLPKTYIDKLLVENLSDSNTIRIETKESEDMDKVDPIWEKKGSMFNFFITDDFIEEHFQNNTSSFKDFNSKFQDFTESFTKFSKVQEYTEEKKRTHPFSIISVFYLTKENKVFQFHFDVSDESEKYLSHFLKIFDLIQFYNSRKENDLKSSIEKSISPHDEIHHFIYNNDQWEFLNPLLEISKEINEKYRKNKDPRVKKPHILMNKENLDKYFVFDRNWVLVFDELEVLMTKPNDVSIYSNISDQNLAKAIQDYKEKIIPKYGTYLGGLPNSQTQENFYNYFELIISAVIFAYTALEAFANICIPNNFEYTIEKGGVKTIFSKEAIERKFSLRDKFKKILSEILNTPDPTKEDWWQPFIDLEEIRNEIIHTKQAKSEDRYSRLLSKYIFELIENHKEIIRFYGEYISKNKEDLLEEFPYNLGYDDFIPGLMTNKNYEKSYRSIHNITLTKKTDEEE